MGLFSDCVPFDWLTKWCSINESRQTNKKKRINLDCIPNAVVTNNCIALSIIDLNRLLGHFLFLFFLEISPKNFITFQILSEFLEAIRSIAQNFACTSIWFNLIWYRCWFFLCFTSKSSFTRSFSQSWLFVWLVFWCQYFREYFFMLFLYYCYVFSEFFFVILIGLSLCFHFIFIAIYFSSDDSAYTCWFSLIFSLTIYLYISMFIGYLFDFSSFFSLMIDSAMKPVMFSHLFFFLLFFFDQQSYPPTNQPRYTPRTRQTKLYIYTYVYKLTLLSYFFDIFIFIRYFMAAHMFYVWMLVYYCMTVWTVYAKGFE